MKRIGIFFILFHMVLFSAFVYAQSARIIDLAGPVLVKEGPESDWCEAKLNMLLDKDAEVQTKKDASCTLAFDEEQKNILTLKENSRIKIENIEPGKVFLPEGRVFSLIEGLAKTEKFEIRTPTAIAGVRGTGWITDYRRGRTFIDCFNDIVYAKSLNEEGTVTGQEDTPSGYRRSIRFGGFIGELIPLGGGNYQEWGDFIDHVNKVAPRGVSAEGKDVTGTPNITGGYQDPASHF
ncbi:FecR domain-containing protein [Candidatus Omnitrophota bacterium]